MESKTNTDKKTPAKSMQNILLEKAVHGKFSCAFGCDSPFRLLPPASTPPSRLTTIRNPFESYLTESLHRPVFSPNVFNNITIPKTEEKFKWTIEDISSLKPADIDEATVEQFEETDHDPEMELTAQASIEKFFSEKQIVPSPFDAVVNSTALISESTSPIEVEAKQVVDEMAQTVLTLPPNLPEQFEAMLKPYFSYTVDQQRVETNNKNSSLYRRLFEYDGDEEQSPASVLTSPAPSCMLSPIDFSPYDENKAQSQRNFGSPHDTNQIAECNLSPINLSPVQRSTRLTPGTRLNFSGRMSIDTSLNVVPDTFDELPTYNQSILFESMHSPVREALSNSYVNWDMEYKHISLESPKRENCNLNENSMDISHSNTPKSKIFMSQRKKLSDSFLKIEESEEDQANKENIYEIDICNERRIVKSNLFTRDDTTDAGYQTAGGLTMSEESWSSSHLFASTPTKNKN